MTWAGGSYVSRFGSSAHRSLGLLNLVADSRENYLEIVAELAADMDRLLELRATLRERMAASVLLDHAGFTRRLEAAYLATGLARRADAIRQAMAAWRQFRPGPYDASKGIQLGALVCLVDADDKQQQLFLGPGGGSMQLLSGTQLIQVISEEAPLGRAMLGKCEGDAVSIQVDPRRQFEVLRVH